MTLNISKKVYIVSLGCPKNLVDSEVMLGVLGETGYQTCEAPEDADLLLVNTCGFIQSAVEEGIDEILELVRVRQHHPDKVLAVTGCMVQRYGEHLQKELPEVDLFIGTEGFHDIGAYLKKFETDAQKKIYVINQPFLMDSTIPRRIAAPYHRAYLKVTEGCANRCTYCLIPSIRGNLRSRPLYDLLREAERLGKGGVKELTLVAQDLTAYGGDLGKRNPKLLDLLEGLLECCDIPWFRLLYLYPLRVDDKLLDFMVANPRILPYLDIPLQHVSSHILKAMNRPYTNEKIEDLMSLIHDKLPNAAIRTTFMVGFPGETEADVEQLEEFLRRHRLDNVGIFAYSDEEGCAASKLPDHCSEEVKAARRQRLMKVQKEICFEKNKGMIGKVEQVLVEGESKETNLLLEGRTRYQAPEIDGCVYINSGVCNPGDIVDVQITEAHPYDLVGEIIDG